MEGVHLCHKTKMEIVTLPSFHVLSVMWKDIPPKQVLGASEQAEV